MNITTRRTTIVGLAVAAASLAPGVAGASNGDLSWCAPKTFKATANNQHLEGTPCNDTFIIGPFSGVSVTAGDGNDTVRAGWAGTSYLQPRQRRRRRHKHPPAEAHGRRRPRKRRHPRQPRL